MGRCGGSIRGANSASKALYRESSREPARCAATASFPAPQWQRSGHRDGVRASWTMLFGAMRPSGYARRYDGVDLAPADWASTPGPAGGLGTDRSGLGQRWFGWTESALPQHQREPGHLTAMADGA
jgi:hypothetical protein